MRTITKYFTYLSILALFTGCGKDWLDVNKDPNNAGSAAVENVLPAGVMSTATVVGGYYNLLGGIWSQYYTQGNASNQYKYIDSYGLLNTDFQGQWAELYSGALGDLTYAKKMAAKDENWSYYLMATTMECYTWQVLVDLYGEIPFNEALKGTDNLKPHYDNAQLVYDSLIVRLDYALAKTLNGLTTDQMNRDLMFQGNVDKWVRFANTLKLKIYMRQMYIRPAVAQAGIEKLYADGAQFLNVDASLNIYKDEANKDNPLYASDKRGLNTTTNLRVSATIFKYFQSKADPRLAKIAEVTGKVPLPQGGYDLGSDKISSNSVSLSILAPTDAVYLISLPESYFLQAEAVAKGWSNGTGDDKALYDAGVTAAFNKWGLGASAAAFLAAGGAYEYPAAGTFEQKQEAIIMAKWASMVRSQGLESFFETNRTHYPSPATTLNNEGWTANTFSPSNALYMGWNGGQMLYSLAGTTGGSFPKRLLFPATERQRNTNTPAEKPVVAKVWWDVKP